MNRPLLACAFFALASSALVAQDATQSQYQGTSNPPPDDTIITTEQQAPVAKPSPAHPMTQAPVQAAPAPMNAVPRNNGTDQDIVTAPPLNTRASNYDPDSDIVHPAPLPPGTLGEGTLIR